ncbi:hypothetical protein KP509_23G019300 [Ceratopteris richardii]|uniref:Uncharacterized protein n=1 Tax=Ceratopteris richardii TaxID=49495 RepID=A0A8T2RY22_CERRI|nr:hypothetical protein KP509_23G019300 [Ceratopteris richardii]
MLPSPDGTERGYETSRRSAAGFWQRVVSVGACINIVLAIPIIVIGFWLASRHHHDCIKFLEIPILFIGFGLVLVSIFGFIWAKNCKADLVRLYLFAVLLLLLLLLAFTLFTFVVTHDSGGHAVPAATYLEYNLAEYSTWFQDQVKDSLRWSILKSCIKDQHPCTGLNKLYSTALEFDDAYLTPIQSGCCKPPSACGFTFVKPTQWITATRSGASSDCGLWSNGSGMCYDCNTCKAGLLETVRQDWNNAADVCLAVFILLFVVYLVSLFAFLKGDLSRSPGSRFGGGFLRS